MYENYDLIFILDACRFDYFQKVLPETNLIGNLTKFNTQTSTTFEWYKKYWSKPNEFNLISENPQPFHKNSNLAHRNFKTSRMSFGDTWLKIDPEQTIKSLQIEPDEKYLVHLLPPHLPFVYDGSELMKGLKPINIYYSVQSWGRKNGFKKLREYYANQILNVLTLIEDNCHLWIDRKILITSDHGELLGEQEQYDHPPNPADWQKPILYQVPKFELDVEQTLIQKRLKMLGY